MRGRGGEERKLDPSIRIKIHLGPRPNHLTWTSESEKIKSDEKPSRKQRKTRNKTKKNPNHLVLLRHMKLVCSRNERGVATKEISEWVRRLR